MYLQFGGKTRRMEREGYGSYILFRVLLKWLANITIMSIAKAIIDAYALLVRATVLLRVCTYHNGMRAVRPVSLYLLQKMYAN